MTIVTHNINGATGVTFCTEYTTRIEIPVKSEFYLLPGLLQPPPTLEPAADLTEANEL
jgi:hypothetical protein